MDGWYNSIRRRPVWLLKKLRIISDTPVEVITPVTSQLTKVLEPWESYMITIQSLLIWEKPSKSVMALMITNLIFWLIVWSQPKVYFVASSLGLLVFLHQQWVHSIWPEIRVPLQSGDRPPHYTDEWLYLNPSVMSAPEVGALLEQWWDTLRRWLDTCLHTRRHRPAMFCVCSSSIFCLLLAAGQVLSGTVLLYGGLMTALLAPGASRHMLPAVASSGSMALQHLKHKCLDRFGPSIQGDGDGSPDDLSEFLPECGTAEAEAALAVPLMEADPAQEVLEGASPSEYLRVTRHGALPLSQGSPYSSLTPNMPANSDLLGVSDSSDEEEQEFMQGLVFDTTKRSEGRSSLQSLEFDSIPSRDHLDTRHFPPASALQPAAIADMSPNTAVQTIASTLLQYPAVGSEVAGALLSTLGQSVLSSVMSNINSGLDSYQAGPGVGASVTPVPASDDEGDYGAGGGGARYTARGDAGPPDRRNARRGASRVVRYDVDSESDSEGDQDNDFEIITDDEMSE